MSLVIDGCEVASLDANCCSEWIEKLLGQKPCGPAGGPQWAIAHCEDGVTWGSLVGEGWRLGSAAFPDLCPRPAPEKLLELRIFSEEEEVLIWRVPGRRDLLAGRLVRDDPGSPGDLPPAEECRPLLGNKLLAQAEGFARVADGSGVEQVLPVTSLDPRPRLRVRHYFAANDAGVARVALSRLVEVL